MIPKTLHALHLEKPWVIAFLSIIAGLGVGALVLLIAGFDPLVAYGVMFSGVFGSFRDISYVVIRSTPLILTGLSVAFAFRTGLFNIGAEGQFIIGALASALTGAFLNLPFPLHPLICLCSGFVAAMLWGGLAGVLKATCGVHEVISTIMLNWTAFYLNNLIIATPGIKYPLGESTPPILESARIDFLGAWKITAEGLAFRKDNPVINEFLITPLHSGILIVLICVFLVGFILNKTTLGFSLKAVGFNPMASQTAGISIKRSMVVSMAIAGALAGLAGSINVLGVTQKATTLAVMEGNGFDGIAVALIGNSSALGSLVAGFLFGALKHAGPKIQPALRAPTEIINIVMGSIIFFLAIPGALKIIFSPVFVFFQSWVAKFTKVDK